MKDLPPFKEKRALPRNQPQTLLRTTKKSSLRGKRERAFLRNPELCGIATLQGGTENIPLVTQCNHHAETDRTTVASTLSVPQRRRNCHQNGTSEASQRNSATWNSVDMMKKACTSTIQTMLKSTRRGVSRRGARWFLPASSSSPCAPVETSWEASRPVEDVQEVFLLCPPVVQPLSEGLKSE
ncbi:hypothetical protein HPB51_023773 [Rhipicephalus microplus]|uniref:Uncharacterized protein n=1 Tax=Rhipicephalus microplus TaxID=6941 RepID=A0A9J6E557_RHIMP|nr:hypothetical protein HPB51_023773 [Rhipicephalus microplus]